MLLGTAGGYWAWLESPSHKVRVLMDRLYDHQPNYVQQLLIKVGLTKPHKALSDDSVVAEIILIGRPALPQVIECLKDLRKEVRCAAVDAMGELGQGAEFDSLMPLLRDGDWQVRMSAVYVLGRAKHKAAVEPLIQMLSGRGDVYLTWLVADALMEIGDRRAAVPLIELLTPRKGGQEIDYRQKFLCSEKKAILLARLGGPELRDFFIVCLEHDSYYVRSVAAEALGEIGDRAGVMPLIRVLRDGPDSVRLNAIESLGAIGDLRAVEPLVELMTCETVQVRLDSAAALCRLGNERGRAALLAMLDPPGTSYSRFAVARLAEFGDKAALEALTKMMGAPAWDDRTKAAEMLGALGDHRAVDSLIAGLEDSDNFVRSQSAQSLGALGDKRAVEPLKKLFMGTRDPSLRCTAAVALGELGDTQAAIHLVPLLDKDEFEVVLGTVWALEALRTREAIGPLKRKLRQFESDLPKEWQPWNGRHLQLRIAHTIRAIEDGKPPDPPRAPVRRRPLATMPASASKPS